VVAFSLLVVLQLCADDVSLSNNMTIIELLKSASLDNRCVFFVRCKICGSIFEYSNHGGNGHVVSVVSIRGT
jgi:hypothetical protein